MGNNLKSIEELGFKYAGKWELGKGEKLFVSIEQEWQERKVLYAFVVDNEIKYLGKTNRKLKDRMLSVVHCDETQKVNRKNLENIKGILKNGGNVLIYAMSNSEIVKNAEKFAVLMNYVAGTEDGLINELSPEWNKIGVKK